MMSEMKPRDPVCGMQVEGQKSAGTSRYGDHAYYFCSPSCKAAFDKEPSKYIKAEEGMEHSHHH